jgi:hypothetical protein
MGWRELIVFPDLTKMTIKAKIDSGARTTALHAYDIEVVKERRLGSILMFILFKNVKRLPLE